MDSPMAADDDGEETFLWAAGGPTPMGSPAAWSAAGSQGEPESSPIEDLVDSEDEEGLTGVAARRARQLRREKSEAQRLLRFQQAAALRRERSRDESDAMILDVQEVRAKRLAAKLAAKRWARSSDALDNTVEDDEQAENPEEEEEICCTRATFVENKQDRARRKRVAAKAALRRRFSRGETDGADDGEAETNGCLSRHSSMAGLDAGSEATCDKDALSESGLERYKSTRSLASQDPSQEAKNGDADGVVGTLERHKSSRSAVSQDPGRETEADASPGADDKKEKKKEKKEKKDKSKKNKDKEDRKRSRSWTPPSPRAMAIAKALASGAPYLAKQIDMGGALPQAGPSIVWDPRINAPVADGQAQLPPSQQLALTGPAAKSPYAKEVDEFLSLGGVDEAASTRMRRLPPHLQRAIMDKGPVQGHPNPSSVLVSRMRDAELGRIQPATAAPAIAAPQLALPAPGDPTSAMLPR